MTDYYRISDFARLAGITVRTLQYYDRIDLLKPSATTDAQHRLYQRSDLLRLQQILTLKWMGFKLDQIKALLDSPAYDLHSALTLQKEAIDRKITQLQQASEVLADALVHDDLDAGLLDQQQIQQIIHAVVLSDQQWLRGAFSDAAWAGIVNRRMQYTTEDFEQFEQDWQDLIAKFERVQHLTIDSDRVQELAATMHGYIQTFSIGDHETEAGVATIWQNQAQMPVDYQIADTSLMRFMQTAYAHYRQSLDN